MIASWRLRLLTVMTGTLLIASAATTDVQRFDGPIITPSVNEYILQAGQNFTLNCKGKSPVQFKQQEQPEVAMEQFYMEQRNIPSVNEFEYEVELTLYNVDRDAIGYYACFDGSVSNTDVLSEISEEPNNTAHISYIYIFVNDSSMFAPMRALVIAKSDSKFIIECRPTTPDIKVKLTSDFADVEYDRYNPKVGFTLDGDVVSTTSIFNCSFVRYDRTIHKEVVVYKHVPTPPAVPTIFGGSQCFLEGEIFSVNCTVNVIRNVPVDLAWTIPGSLSKVTNSSNGYKQRDLPLLFNNYTIHNATAEDAGTYVCTAKNGHGAKTATVYKKYLEKPVIIMEKRNQKGIIETNIRAILLRVDIFDYPPVDVVLYRDNNPLYIDGGKVNVSLSRDQLSCSAKCYIKIKPLLIEDTANYTLVATNKLMSNNVTFDLRVRAPPTVDFGPDTDRTYVIGTQATLICEVTGYPLPQVDWIFSDDEGEQVIDKKFQDDTAETVYKLTSLLTIKAHVSGNIACQATNTMNSTFSSRNFFVYELPGGFGIKERDRTWFWQGQRVILTCLASKYDFTNVTWFGFENESIPEDKLNSVSYSSSPFSHIATLKIDQITLSDAGGYVCVGQRNDDTEENETITVTVAEIQEPEIKDQEDLTVEVLIYHAINFTCTASAIPPPVINWYKGAEVLRNLSDDNMFINTSNINQSTRYSIVKIEQMQEENVGTYECRAISNGVIQSKFYNLQIKERPSHKATYLSVIGVIFFVLILLVVYLTWKIRKEKQFRKELAAAGLLNFKEGVTKSINPDLGIDEQAELLPYDEKFEFPVDKLILGKQLGAGAFGVVYKADARGIVNAELTTTVAVKMVKKTADNMYIKALASELKIMVHLGKHINIVNLLGACTKNVGKRELLVIVEYCKYGNIHNYMQKHREVFIDQFTDNPEKNFGKINRGYSCSSGNSGLHSDYFGSNHTQDTDHTFLNTANTNRSGRKDPKQVEFIKVSETGYVQPEWRSNYESDYSFDGRSPRPLCSRDLLAWAFQIARGMEYLASRKVLHGDLAARNVLLADDNIVKICDFGLARSIYKNDEYQKQENSPLPVKWLAIECMTDRIFSTQSDVWSFGIVLWELFSLAKTPYPNVSPPSLLQWLSEGRRLEKPSYADDKLYELMLQCWQQKPTSRPSFSQLQQILGSFLEDNVRNHYVDLNASYLDMNIRREGEDYLAMVNAPDYNNMITPSPHHYMNDARSFFPATPTQLQHDDEGYLQMSPATRQTIFNARAQGTKFDFDARKLAPRASEPSSHGSELTPMLTLNNLPRSGSESDHEGNSSPYLNMCPRIEEETDEVFEMRQNAKNIQPTAVTNPTYITFSADDEKKPPNFSNNYINVPNGLVK